MAGAPARSVTLHPSCQCGDGWAGQASAVWAWFGGLAMLDAGGPARLAGERAVKTAAAGDETKNDGSPDAPPRCGVGLARTRP